MIEVNDCTLLYPSKKGIANVSFSINQGEIFGYLGPNGAGKTTTIRAMMGFMKPQEGKILIRGYDAWEQSSQVQKYVGYLPGEIAFFDEMSGMDFLKFQAELRGLNDLSLMYQLIHRFELDLKSKIRKMSKGMKQKIGLICAFMHDPDVYILDEPTSGLDPLMQQVFVELVLEKKREGKTILMSSHSFEEVEKTCDRIAMIKEGRIAVVEDITVLKKQRRKVFVVTVANESHAQTLVKMVPDAIDLGHFAFEVAVIGDFRKFFDSLKTMDIIDLDVKTQRIEEIFMQYYGKGNHHESNPI